MDPMELMKQRHSVRQFTEKQLESSAVAALQSEIDKVNEESGMHIPDWYKAGLEAAL